MRTAMCADRDTCFAQSRKLACGEHLRNNQQLAHQSVESG